MNVQWYRIRGPNETAMAIEDDHLERIYIYENKKSFTVLTHFKLRQV
jgi:hypothetical protein